METIDKITSTETESLRPVLELLQIDAIMPVGGDQGIWAIPEPTNFAAPVGSNVLLRINDAVVPCCVCAVGQTNTMLDSEIHVFPLETGPLVFAIRTQLGKAYHLNVADQPAVRAATEEFERQNPQLKTDHPEVVANYLGQEIPEPFQTIFYEARPWQEMSNFPKKYLAAIPTVARHLESAQKDLQLPTDPEELRALVYDFAQLTKDDAETCEATLRAAAENPAFLQNIFKLYLQAYAGSPRTLEHAHLVARTAEAEIKNYTEQPILHALMYLRGLLHDVGKLNLVQQLIEKGLLTANEKGEADEEIVTMTPAEIAAWYFEIFDAHRKYAQKNEALVVNNHSATGDRLLEKYAWLPKQIADGVYHHTYYFSPQVAESANNWGLTVVVADLYAAMAARPGNEGAARDKALGALEIICEQMLCGAGFQLPPSFSRQRLQQPRIQEALRSARALDFMISPGLHNPISNQADLPNLLAEMTETAWGDNWEGLRENMQGALQKAFALTNEMQAERDKMRSEGCDQQAIKDAAPLPLTLTLQVSNDKDKVRIQIKNYNLETVFHTIVSSQIESTTKAA